MAQDNVETLPDAFRFERLAYARGCRRVAGVDEVGRGPLAGPVVAAAVVLPRRFQHAELADSKTLAPKKRERIAAELYGVPGIQIGIGSVSPAEIDRMNILRATHLAMRKALLALDPQPEFALVDGLRVPDLPVPARFVVRGDALSASIAAASIIAKVYRDRLMAELDTALPGYGFARHKGYATAAHLRALAELGPTVAHRQTFAPVARIRAEPPVQMHLTFEAHQPAD